MRSSSSNAIIGCSHRKQRHTKEFFNWKGPRYFVRKEIYTYFYIITFTLRKLRVHSFGAILAISYSGLGITEYTEFQFRKERSLIWKRNTHGGGDLGTTIPAGREGFPAKNFPKERVFCLFRVNRIPFHSVSFCDREQNERNDIPFIPKTE